MIFTRIFLGLIASVAIIVGIGSCCFSLHLAGCVLRVLLVPPVDWAMASFLVATTLAVGGFGLLSLFYVKKQWRIYQLKKWYPDEPWMWREDWAVGVAKCSTLGAMTALWACILLCWVFGSCLVYHFAEISYYIESLDLVSAAVQNRASQLWRVLGGDAPVAKGPGVVSFEPDQGDVHNGFWHVGCIALGVGIVPLVPSLLWTLRWLRFGRSVFEMEDGPGVIGGVLKGTIRLFFSTLSGLGGPVR